MTAAADERPLPRRPLPWLGRFSRSVLREIGVHVSMTTLAVITLFVCIDLVENGNLVRRDTSTAALVLLELYSLPAVLQQVLGMTVLVGTMTGVAGLIRRNEILVMLSAGASPVAVLKPTLLLGLVLALGYAGLTEWIAPSARAELAALRRALGLPSRNTDVLRRGQTWYRGRDHFFRIQEIEDSEGRQLGGVLMLRVRDGQLLDRWDIERLVYDGTGWTGEEVVHRAFQEGKNLATRRLAEVELPLAERPRDFVGGIGAPDWLAYRDLRAALASRERLGQPAIGHRLELHRRHTIPLSLLAMMALGAGLTLRLGRRPSLVQALGVGATLGFVLWLTEEVGQALGATAAVPPLLAAHLGTTAAWSAALAVWLSALRRGLRE